MAPHSSTLAWKIPWTEEPARLQSMKFSRPEYWNGKPFSSPGDLPNPGIKPRSPAFQADSLPAESQGKQDILEYCLFSKLLNFIVVK